MPLTYQCNRSDEMITVQRSAVWEKEEQRIIWKAKSLKMCLDWRKKIFIEDQQY